MLQVTNVRKVFNVGGGQVAAIDGVSLSVETGQFVAIVGRSGSGKTTLMSLLGALDKPTSGTITVDGQNITNLHDRALIKYRGEKIGFVFQGYNLVPNLSALENVMLPMETGDSSKREHKKRAQLLLEKVGLSSDKQRRKPGRLSGGEQQRVAIARAPANQPKLILAADEPTGNLDSQTSQMIISLLREMSRTAQVTIIVVTHDSIIAKQAEKAFRLQDGKVVNN